jgi:hypothetical protein
MRTIDSLKSPLVNGRIIKTDTPIKEYLECNSWAIQDNGTPRVLSRSDLCDIYACPHKWYRASAMGKLEPDRPTPSMDFGSLVDCLLLQPARFNEYYILAPPTYETTKGEIKSWTWKSSTCREWREEQEATGIMVCIGEKLDEAQAALNEFRCHPKYGEQTKRLISNSTHQVFVIAEYHDEETGLVVPVKCLTDIVPNSDDPEFGKCLFDLKTAVDASPRKWARAVADNNYHVQAAINLDCHNAVAGAERIEFRHLIIENVAPWEPAFRFLSSGGEVDFVNAGRAKYLAALRTYCHCMKTGEWPSYAPLGMVLDDGYEAVEMQAWMV